MVYYLNDVESKNLLKNLRPLARKVGVSEELRGWNWDQSPLKYYRDIKLPMYLICGNYCPTSRNVYLDRVENKKGEYSHHLSLGKVIHDTVAWAYTFAREGEFNVNFDDWYELQRYGDYIKGNREAIQKYAKVVYYYILDSTKSQYNILLSSRPHSNKRDILLTAVPFLVEHKINGELLGCSDILSIDCYDYLHNIIFDLKVGSGKDKSVKLQPTGYALVFESIHEIPVDIGGTVNIWFQNDQIHIKKELFHINDNLRSWWIELRDKKVELVYAERDPGIPDKCPPGCIYQHICGV